MPIDQISWWKVLKWIDQKFFVRRDGKRRNTAVLAVLALLAASTVYFLTVGYIAPSRNVFLRGYRAVRGLDEYTFHAGSKSGAYSRIGKEIEEMEEDLGFKLKVENHKEGTAAVLARVLNGTASAGLVEDRFARKQEIAGVNIRRIAPVYDERLHVLYNAGKWRQVLRDCNLPAAGLPVLSPDPSDAVREFFENSVVRFKTVRPGAGEYPLGKQLLETCRLKPKEMKWAGFKASFEALRKGDLDIGFFTAGAPLTDIVDLLDDLCDDGEPKFSLMAVHPGTAQKLNSMYQEAYKVTSFGGTGYPFHAEEIPTISTTAVLVVSQDTPDPVIGTLLNALVRVENTVDANPPLPVIEYADSLREAALARTNTTIEAVETWGLSLLVIGLLMIVFYSLGVGLLSTAKHTLYSDEISTVYDKALPDHFELDAVGRMKLPKVDLSTKGNHQIITEIVEGISHLLKLSLKIRRDYGLGGISLRHQEHLIDALYQTKAILQKHLAQRLRADIESGGLVTREDVRTFYFAGYLGLREQDSLLGAIERMGPPPPQGGTDSAAAPPPDTNPTADPAPAPARSTLETPARARR